MPMGEADPPTGKSGRRIDIIKRQVRISGLQAVRMVNLGEGEKPRSQFITVETGLRELASRHFMLCEWDEQTRYLQIPNSSCVMIQMEGANVFPYRPDMTAGLEKRLAELNRRLVEASGTNDPPVAKPTAITIMRCGLGFFLTLREALDYLEGLPGRVIGFKVWLEGVDEDDPPQVFIKNEVVKHDPECYPTLRILRIL